MASSSDSPPSTLILIDGHSLAFRSYYAHAKGREGGLRTSTGIPTSVSFGFLKALLEMMEQEKPEYLAIAFDLGDPTFRHEADETYKEGRPDTPEDFIPDLRNLQELLGTLNLPMFAVPGYEADDIIGTLARRAKEENFRVKILTGDRDLFQLIDPEEAIKVMYLASTFANRGGNAPPREFGVQQVKEKMGILPSQVVDYKALCGDASDNIPGVRGIGDKTAVQLLNTYGSLHGIYDSLDQIKGAVRKKLEEGKDEALHSQYLAQIHLDVPVDKTVAECRLSGFDEAIAIPLLEKLEFRSFLGKIRQIQQQLGGTVAGGTVALETRVAEQEGSDRTDSAQPSDPESGDLWFFSAEDTAEAQKQSQPLIQPQIIDTPEKLVELAERLQTYTDPAVPIAWDTETSALDPYNAALIGIGCCWGEQSNQMAYIPIGHQTGTNLDQESVFSVLRPILESAAHPKTLQNAKFDRLIFRCQGIHLAGVVFDTMLASYVLNPDGTHNLTELGRKYLDIRAKSYEDLVPKGKTIAAVDIPAAAEYCGTDAYTTFRLVPLLRAELAALPKLDRLLLTVEQPLEPVLAEMEYHGIRIDQEYLQELSNLLEQDLAALEQQAYAAAGETFNLGSPKQLGDLLFEKLGLDRKKSRKTKTGYSTDATTLEKLQGDHPVIDAILEYRTLSKLKSTYVDALPTLVQPKTQRVHTDFNQAVTATGRLSSSNPNLQNIPIRTAFSRQIRKAFVPKSDWLLVTADYSQIELRILTHLSQEPVLIETYQKNEDVHTLTARLLFEKETITPEERRLAKVINFGVIYGMGAQRFAREAGFKLSEAKMFIQRFNDRYSRVFDYLQQMQREAIAHGYVETILGRRRYFNFASETLRSLRGSNPDSIDLDKIKLRDQYDAQLLRAAANAPIQGSSADIIKVAMVQLHDQLQHHQVNLLLQVHDELVFEIHPQEWESLKPQIKHIMESALQLTVPLVVEIGVGANWMEAK
jgi:DNA polymerase I